MQRKIEPDILAETAKILENHFATKIAIGRPKFLSSPERRNALIRLEIKSSQADMPKSVILKLALSEKADDDLKTVFERFSRDYAGLDFLSGTEAKVLVPQFYGGSIKHRF